MKKFISLFALAIVLTAFANQANAQNKIGYFSVDQMLGLMPEAVRIDSLLQKYRVDSLNSMFSSIVQEYQYKDSMLNKTDTSKTPKTVLNQYRTDLSVLGYQIQNWDALANQAVQNKQEQLVGPVYTRIINAMNTVAKEKGYGYVLSKESLLVAPPGDDMLPLVAAKLGVKLPASATQPKPGTTKPNQ
jgi:outer membrane protein